jgi:N-acetylglucosamine kinase-like BadF-type ATPase
MSKLSETAQRILGEMEEFQYEDVYNLINAIQKPSGAASEVAEFVAAVRELLREEMVTFALDDWKNDDVKWINTMEAMKILKTPEELFVFDIEGSIWTTATGDYRTAIRPSLQTTDKGNEVAFKIVDERGYKWWEQMK